MAELESAIIALLREKGGGVTFVELARLPGFEGTTEVSTEPGSNCYLWLSCSPEAVATMCRLMDTGVIEMRTTQPIVYYADGRVPSLPVADRPRRYKSPHWLPAAFSRGPQFPHPSLP